MITWLLAFQLSFAGALSDGAAAFEEGRLGDAIEIYRGVESPSGSVLFNLGNAYYRQGDRARALACFRQAQRLRPRDGNIHHNLAMVRTELEAVAPPGTADRMWVNVVTPGELGAMAWLLTLLGSGLLWSRRGRRGSGLPLGAGAMVVVGFGLSVEAWLAGASPAIGVVVEDDARLRDAPRPDGDVVWTFGVGSELVVEREYGDFRLVRDGDGRRGWVPQTSLWWPGQDRVVDLGSAGVDAAEP